jgi:hypothetical protein
MVTSVPSSKPSASNAPPASDTSFVIKPRGNAP